MTTMQMHNDNKNSNNKSSVIISQLLSTIILLLLILNDVSFSLIEAKTIDNYDQQIYPDLNDEDLKLFEREKRKFLARTGSGIKMKNYEFELPEVLDLRPEELKRTKTNIDLAKPQTYGVIVDCGSSGTRAHLYHWDTEIDYSLQMLHDIEPVRKVGPAGVQTEPVEKKVTPGLATFSNATRGERIDYIKPLIDFVASNIPETRHKYTGVYLMATAGMRLLEEEDRQSIMEDIRLFIKDKYNFAKVETSVISGADEGMYQWININAKGKRFLSYDSSIKTKTYAVIEMGGASIQVIYQLRPGVGELQVRSLPTSVQPVYWAQVVEPAISRSNILEHNYSLHSTTFLGLGINSALDAYRDLLIYKQNKSLGQSLIEGPKRFVKSCFGFGCPLRNDSMRRRTRKQQQFEQPKVYEDPCLPRGYNTTKPLTKPLRMLDEQATKEKIVGFIVEDEEPTFEYLLVGTGNYDKCKKLVDGMLKLARKNMMFCEKENDPMCTMALLGERFVPFQRFDFVAISSFYHAFRNDMIAKNYEVYDHEHIVRKTRLACNMPFEVMKNRFAGMGEHMITACFRAVYADAFLVKGLRMPEDFDMLETKNKINNDELDWTLGAILDKSLAIEKATEVEIAKEEAEEESARDEHIME